MEYVKFDMQLMENAEISRCRVPTRNTSRIRDREYLLEKWGRKCTYCRQGKYSSANRAYCPTSKGWFKQDLSNLCLACEKCNTAKGTKDIKDFFKKKPELLKKIVAQAKAPLRDAAAVNATRWELFRRLQVLGLPIECGSGGLTKYNRTMRELPKTHWIDAACVGKSTPEHMKADWECVPLAITAYGHGSRQMCLMNRYGFPRTDPKEKHPKHGFKTGDIIKAIVPAHLKRAGTQLGECQQRLVASFHDSDTNRNSYRCWEKVLPEDPTS